LVVNGQKFNHRQSHVEHALSANDHPTEENADRLAVDDANLPGRQRADGDILNKKRDKAGSA